RGAAATAIIPGLLRGRRPTRGVPLGRGGSVSNPVPKTDTVFLKHFVQLIAALIVLAVLLALLGAYIHHRHPPEANPDRAKVIGQRIAPVGGVYAGDTGRAAMEAARE